MKRNGISHIFVLTFVISILVAINIHDVDAKMNPDQLRNMLKPMAKTCIQKTGVDKDLVAATKDGVYADDPKLKCYETCLMRMMKSMTKDNKLAVDSMIKQIEMMVEDEWVEKMKTATITCAEKSSSTDPCEIGWEFVKCYDEFDHSLTFFP
ncbi:general odorant-binding protein 72-like [Chelonus insularis]|uniref:general odorant-binding protein 72-like n=1 Tax=Chelonus insularis TaxID=460826 RepID=UPI00158F05A6|nr:general odorant-binding protein 72-like [Chelonus insularis]